MLACAMAEVVRVQCLVCKEYCSPQKRRKLQSPSTEHIVPILQELLPERVHVKLTTAYACIPCFRSADKLLKLRKEVRKKEKELQQQVNHRKDGLIYYLRLWFNICCIGSY